MKLVVLEANYADEFDVFGMRIMTETEFDTFENDVKFNSVYPFESYFGTNEALEFFTAEDYWKCIKVYDISNSVAEELKDTALQLGEFGHFAVPELREPGDEEE